MWSLPCSLSRCHLNRISWRSSFAMAGIMWSLTSRCSFWVHCNIASVGGAEFHRRTLKPCDGACLCWQNVVANWLPMDRWNGTWMMNWLEAWNQFKLGLIPQRLERRLDENFRARTFPSTAKGDYRFQIVTVAIGMGFWQHLWYESKRSRPLFKLPDGSMVDCPTDFSLKLLAGCLAECRCVALRIL